MSRILFTGGWEVGVPAPGDVWSQGDVSGPREGTAFVSHHELHLEFQETLDVEGLPTSRPDYVIYTKNTKILGCVEIKGTNLVAQKALVQCRLQLLSLHTRANHSLFGIVTDGKTFILMTLDEEGIFHEEEDYGTEGSIQRAKRTCENWDDLKEILEAINDLLCHIYNEATQSVNVTGTCKPTLKKPTLKNKAAEPSQFKSTSKSSRTSRHGEEGTVLKTQQGMQGLTINEQEPTSKGSSTPLKEQGELVPHTTAPHVREQLATTGDAEAERKMVLELLRHSLDLLRLQKATRMTPDQQYKKERDLECILAQLEEMRNIPDWKLTEEVEIQGVIRTTVKWELTVVSIISRGPFSGNESVIEVRICAPQSTGIHSPPRTIYVNLEKIREYLQHIIMGKK